MATCVNCKTSSRVDPDAITIRPILVVKPPASFSLAGAQIKTTGSLALRMKCARCGWSVLGRIEADQFVADMNTQAIEKE